MRLSRTDLVPVLAIIAGCALGVLTSGALVFSLRSDAVPVAVPLIVTSVTPESATWVRRYDPVARVLHVVPMSDLTASYYIDPGDLGRAPSTTYVEYYSNVIRQMQRCFRWRDGGSWHTTVSFVIERDGSSSDMELVVRSGDSSFDTAVMRAVDCAGARRLGPLPEGLESLPIRFDFRPAGAGR